MASVAVELKCLADAAIRASRALDKIHTTERPHDSKSKSSGDRPPAGMAGSIVNNSTIGWVQALRH